MPCPNSAREKSVTIGFRVTPEEAAEIDALVAISGMTKQDYIVDRLHEREIYAEPSVRFYKGMTDYMDKIYLELRRIKKRGQITEGLERILEDIARVYEQVAVPKPKGEALTEDEAFAKIERF